MEFDLFSFGSAEFWCLCGKLCLSIIGSDSVIYSGLNRVEMKNIGPEYPWFGQQPMDWTKTFIKYKQNN